MTYSGIRKIIADDELTELNSVEEFLHNLRGPSWIFFPGKSNHSCRVITTLLHGNEPSGCQALFRLIKEHYIPAVDTWVLIASISTALQEPAFSRRAKEGLQDLNRCFLPPWNTEIEKLAEQILKDITDFKPEAIVDIHNTSGAGPGFCVSVKSDKHTNILAGMFSNSMVITEIKLGALMEIDFNCPILTVECGGNQSELSHLFAYNGIRNFLSPDHLWSVAMTEDLQYYRHPLRLELKNGYQLTYGNEYLQDSDITLCNSIEEQNFGTTVPGKRLGWLGERGMDCLQVMDSDQQNLVTEYFENKDGELHTKTPVHLFMVTKNRLIAESDCMFYLTSAEVS